MQQNAVNVRKKIFQQLLGVREFVWHALIGRMPVQVVKCQNAPGIFKLFGRPDGVRIVISQNATAMRLVQAERIANAVRDMR